jgi:hypothetical protein
MIRVLTKDSYSRRSWHQEHVVIVSPLDTHLYLILTGRSRPLEALTKSLLYIECIEKHRNKSLALNYDFKLGESI